MGYQYFHGFFIINKYGKIIFIQNVHFLQIYVLLTTGPNMVYHGDSIYISYLYDQMWLVGWKRVKLLHQRRKFKDVTVLE